MKDLLTRLVQDGFDTEASKTADKATTMSFGKGPEAHQEAAGAHREAAKAQRAQGNFGKAKEHDAAADEHDKQAAQTLSFDV